MKFREPLELNCPRCDHRFERSLAWIREDGQRCPECRGSLASIRDGIEGTITDWTHFVEDAERIIAMEDEFKAKIEDLGDWRGETLRRLRALIREADPDVVEELKWKKPSDPTGGPVWSHDGILCTGETYKAHVKLTFAKGAEWEPGGCRLDGGGKVSLRIGWHESDLRQLAKAAGGTWESV